MKKVEIFNDLIDQVVKNIKWNEYEVTFECESGDYTFTAEGDCCSHTYIESFDNYENLKGEIYLVESLDLPSVENNNDSLTQFYGYKFTTKDGDFILDFRNDSNGYYGGWLELKK